MGPLTDDDLDIWKGLPVGQRDSVQGNSPAMGTDILLMTPSMSYII